jgi:hypothetical protein
VTSAPRSSPPRNECGLTRSQSPEIFSDFLALRQVLDAYAYFAIIEDSFEVYTHLWTLIKSNLSQNSEAMVSLLADFVLLFQKRVCFSIGGVLAGFKHAQIVNLLLLIAQ